MEASPRSRPAPHSPVFAARASLPPAAAISPQRPCLPGAVDERLAALEARLRRVEAKLGFAPAAEVQSQNFCPGAAHDAAVTDSFGPGARDAGLQAPFEHRVFALGGVAAVTSGLLFLLSLPHSRLPPAMPAIAGIALASALLLVAHFLRPPFTLLKAYVRGAAMLLLYFATLRCFFFGRPPALDLASFAGRALLVLATAINAALAWRSRSRWLVALALLMGGATGIIVNAGGFLLAWLPALAIGAVLTGRKWDWPALSLAAIPLVHATYFMWATGSPILRSRLHYMGEPASAPGMLLAVAGIFAAAFVFRPAREAEEDGVTHGAALLNCTFGYGAFLVHTAAAFPGSFIALHASAFAVFLGTAVLFWTRERSRISTFVYAITGFIALSMMILKAAPSPQVFVWLSVQSLVVLAASIWFRSRLIVAANFLIYTAIVIGYMFLVKRETGVSLGFGLVALVSARLLNWQQERLELKTEFMRNAYLTSAFIVMPHALYHLVPGSYVGLAWLGLAVGYYAVNLIMQNQKYRWMGHATLALTALYLVLAGPGRIEPAYRVASFLALGSVLLVASLTFRSARR